jgi:hypothetical protein
VIFGFCVPATLCELQTGFKPHFFMDSVLIVVSQDIRFMFKTI